MTAKVAVGLCTLAHLTDRFASEEALDFVSDVAYVHNYETTKHNVMNNICRGMSGNTIMYYHIIPATRVRRLRVI